MRDPSGHTIRSHLWPIFRQSASRAALARGDPIAVMSCWNGMGQLRLFASKALANLDQVVFDASPFQNTTNPLRFRSISDSLAQYHLEASECCLIHADNPIAPLKGNWINPNVRVGYSLQAYQAVAAENVKEQQWPTPYERRWAWLQRLTSWWYDPINVFKLRYRIWLWQKLNPESREDGLSCVEDLAMELLPNGWALRDENFQ